jgi:hypothetical protein
MSYHGGIGAKKGELYERHWTTHCVLRILRGEANSIHLEPLNGADGFEFVLQRDGISEYHQVKRRLTGTGHWTLTVLAAKGVLAAFARKLSTGAHTRFVSAHDADELHELAERAAGATDFEDFHTRLEGRTWTGRFQTLASMMDLDEQSTFQALSKLHVTVMGEDELVAFNEALAEPLIDAPPADSLASLHHLIADATPGKLDAHTVWAALKDTYAKHPRGWVGDQPLRAKVAALADTYMSALEGLRLDHPLERPQITEILELLADDDLDGVMVTAGAGAGKSDILLEVLRGTLARSWPALSIRADHLTATYSPLELGAQLGLPGSPVGVLAALADRGPSLLVIDQLDAVSLASGRLTALWDVLYTLITHAKATPGMRVLLACRQFDVDNDHRMRALSSDRHRLAVVGVPPLEPAQVTRAVGEMGLDAQALSERQRILLAVPLHLVLLQTVAPSTDPLTFTTLTELFEVFWTRKQQDAEHRAGHPVNWASVIRTAADYMNEHRRLDVPASHLEHAGLTGDTAVLVSEHVLVADRRSYRFFHESFFDYAFARFYLDYGNTIGSLLTAGDQELFRRAQVRQLLTQQRDSDPDAYIAAVEELLIRTDVRFHIKQLVAAWLGSLPDPRAQELTVLSSLLDSGGLPDPVKGLIWRTLTGETWFDLLAAEGQLERWLSSDQEQVVGAALQIMRSAVNRHPELIAGLLRANDDGSTLWRDRIAFVISFSDIQHSRDLFDLLLDTLHRDAYLAGNDHSGWLYAHELPTAQATWAAELLTALLTRAGEQATAAGHPHALHNGSPLQHEHSSIEFVMALAHSDPDALLDASIPFIFATIDADLTASPPHARDDERLPVDGIWPYRLDDEVYTFDQALLRGSAEALAALAIADPERFRVWANTLADRRDETSQFLLYEGLLGDPAGFADYTAGLLLEGAWRWWASHSGEPFWLAHRLLSAIAPHLERARIGQLEASILGFATGYEREAAGHRLLGRAEFELLSGLADGDISEHARRRLGELQRKFREPKPEAPSRIVGGVVRSPISRESADHMSDENWLAAIAKHRESWEQKRNMDLIGGARELANVLQAAAQDYPERFAKLGLRLDTDTVPVYFEHLLIGLARPAENATPASLESVVALVDHIAALPGSPARRCLPVLVRRYAAEPVPEHVLALIVNIATGDPDPDRDVWKVDAGNGTRYYGGSILMAGMNSARGAAAEAIAALVYEREDRVELLTPAIASLANDPVTAVRACGAQAVHCLMRWRRDQAVTLLGELARTEDEALLSSEHAQPLLADAIPTHWTAVRPLIEQMLRSAEETVKEAGGTLASIAGLDQPDADTLVEELIIDSDPRVRAGTAKVLSARVISAHYRDRCTQGLERLFDDEDPDVREQSAKAFWRLEGKELEEIESLARTFITSRAFDTANVHFLRALERSTSDVAELALATAERVLGPDRAGGAELRAGAESRILSTLLLRVLGTLDSDRARVNRALDLVDAMLAAGDWGVGEAIETVER